MVFFTCNACGESLKKAQIQKHTGMCRAARVFSCIDCGKDFRGDDYKNHVKCITEDQKYGGKNYEAKASKGDVKQQQWIERIQEALNKPGVNARLKSVLQQVASYDNVPRKKAKFQNWMKNSLKIYDSSLQDQVWDIFSSSTNTTETNGVMHTNAEQTAAVIPEPEEEERADKKKKNKRERKEERQQKSKKRRMDNSDVEDQQNGEEERGKKKKKRKKMEEGEQKEEKPNKIKKNKKKEEESGDSPNTEEMQDDEEVQEEANTKGKFNWKGTIKAVLRQSPEEGIALKKLRKKVLTEYYSFSGDGNHRSEEELYSLFNKKLNNPKFRMVKDKVRLIK